MPSAARAAKNESLFREVNDRILELEENLGEAGLSGFVCECSRMECASKLQATLPEYRMVRAHAARFMVVEDHVDPDHERIVLANERFTVVEKFGFAGAIAEEIGT